MRERFPGYYQRTEDEIAAAWASGMVSVDASVLLGLYEYPEQASTDLFNALSAVQHRLWLPHQAALEYQRNRIRVVANQKSRFEEVRKEVNSVLGSLSGQLSKMQLRRRHSAIDPEPLEKDVAQAINRFVAKLDVQAKKQPDVHDPDPIRDRIDELFAGKVGPPLDQDALDEIYNEGEHRFTRETPPGFADVEKSLKAPSSEFEYAGLVYRPEFGDLILWKQLIAHAASVEISHLIFVTDDQKDDWWWTAESSGPKRLGPRPELVAEIAAGAGVTVYCQYSSESFMVHARERLQVPVSEKSISEVKDVREAERAAVETAEPTGIEFSLDLMVSHEPDCVLFVTLANNLDREATFRDWNAGLQFEGREYQLKCVTVDQPLDLEMEGSTVQLAPDQQLERQARSLPAGSTCTGWTLARTGAHVTPAMLQDREARFHLTANGTERRFWSGPSVGPPDARRFLGPSVAPSETFERVLFEDSTG